MGLPFLYFAIVAAPSLLLATWSDLKTNLIDIRPIYFLVGLLYGGFFANGVSIWLAISVSIVLIVMQWLNGKMKLRPLGGGDFALVQVYALTVILFSPGAWRIISFAGFMLAMLIFLGVMRFLTHNRAFAPAVLFSFLVFGVTKYVYSAIG